MSAEVEDVKVSVGEVTDGKDAPSSRREQQASIGSARQDDLGCLDLLQPPLPIPTPSCSDHGMLPVLGVVLSYYFDEGMVLVLASSVMLGPRADGTAGVIPCLWPQLNQAGQSAIFALYIAIYAIVQFFVSPYTGALSDRHGRKPVLSVCMIGFSVASCLQAAALQFGQGCDENRVAVFIVLFTARLFRGFFGGCTGVVKAVFADIKHGDDRVVSARQQRNFSNFFVYFGFTVGVGRLFGVVLGTYGALNIGYAFPFWFLTVLDVLVTIYLASPLFVETLYKKNARSINPLKGIKFLVWDVWREMPGQVGASLVILVCFRIGWMLFANYLQEFVTESGDIFSLDAAEKVELIGDTWIYGTLFYLFNEFFINQPMTKLKKNSGVIIGIEFLVQGALVLFAPFIKSQAEWFVVMTVIIGLNAFGTPNTMALIAATAPENQAGIVLGSASALKSASYAIAALLTALGGISVESVWFASSGLFFTASALCCFFYLKGLLKHC